jgi:hypothetical protein
MFRVALGLFVIASAYPGFILFHDKWFAVQGAAIVGTFTVGATVVAGIPLAIVFIAKGWVKPWQAVLAGAVVGFACSVPFWFTGSSTASVRVLAIFMVLGAIHGFFFWLLALWKNGRLAGYRTTTSSTPHDTSAA